MYVIQFLSYLTNYIKTTPKCLIFPDIYFSILQSYRSYSTLMRIYNMIDNS